MDERQYNAAERVFELMPPWDREPDKTPEELKTDIYNMISVDPVSTIEYLLDILDNYTS